MIVHEDGQDRVYSEKLACINCGASVPAFEPRSFSFNSPYGACSACAGLGSRWEFDDAKVIVDASKPLLDGAVAAGLVSAETERAVLAVLGIHGRLAGLFVALDP